MTAMTNKRWLAVTGLLLCIILVLGCFCIRLSGRAEDPAAAIACHADTREQIEALKEHGKPMIIAFGADYCPTCVNFEPYIKELYNLYGDEIIIRYVDTVEHEAVRKEFNIELIPSTLFYLADGSVYLSDGSVDILDPEVFTGEPKHVSDTLTEISGKDLGADERFAYGLDENSNPVYCKYVGLLDLVQLKALAEALLQSS